MDPIGVIKAQTRVEKLKWTYMISRAALTKGSWNMRDELIDSIVVLPKEILQMFSVSVSI